MERVCCLWHQNQRINNHIIIGETTYPKHIITDDHSWWKQILVGLKLYKGQTKPYNLKAICLCWDTVGMLDWFTFQQDVLLELQSSVFLVPREKIKLLRPDLRSKCPNRTSALKATVLTSCDAIQSWSQWRGCNIVSLAVTLLGSGSGRKILKSGTCWKLLMFADHLQYANTIAQSISMRKKFSAPYFAS